MGLDLGGHHFYYNITYYCFLWSFTLSSDKSQRSTATGDSHPLLPRIFPINRHDRSLHLENTFLISHRTTPKPNPPPPSSSVFTHLFPKGPTWGLFIAFETQTSFHFPWDKISRNKLAKLSSKDGVLGNERYRREKITIDSISYRNKNKVEGKTSVEHPST